MGCLNLVVAGYALAMNAYLSNNVYASYKEIDMPYFLECFGVLTAISVVINAAIIVTGYKFLRQQYIYVWVFFAANALAYALPEVVGYLWLNPVWGSSLSAVTGISLTGFYLQGISYYNIWAPILVLIAYICVREKNEP
jgi:hypothetical protein